MLCNRSRRFKVDEMAAKRRRHWNYSPERKKRRMGSSHICEICDSRFKSRVDLKVHQEFKHVGNQWKCNTCSAELPFSRSELGKYAHSCKNAVPFCKKSSPVGGHLPMVKEFE